MATKTKNVSNVVALPAAPQLSKVVKTRLNAGAPVQETRLTIVFDSEELVREFAMRAAVIAAQALYRDAGKIPAEETLSLTELRKRNAERGFAKPTPEKAAAAVDKLGDEAYAGVLRNLGMKEAEIKKLLAARISKK